MINIGLRHRATICLVAISAASTASGFELTPVGTIEVARQAPFDDAEDAQEQSLNLSGLVCPASDWCLAVSDEKIGVHRLKIVRDDQNLPSGVSYDKAIKIAKPSEEFLESHGIDRLKELDLEAVTQSADSIYLIGSHANTRTRGEKNPSAHLVAKIDTAAAKTAAALEARWSSLDPFVATDPDLRASLYKQLQCGGLNIEGATVVGGNLYLGLRSPVSKSGDVATAIVLSVPTDDLFESAGSSVTIHRLPMRQPFVGIRSLETVGQDVVMITGDAGVSDLRGGAVPECGANLNKEDQQRPFEVRRWQPAADLLDEQRFEELPPLMITDEDGNEVPAKAEAIAADPAKNGNYFILYDGSPNLYYLTGSKLGGN